VRFWWRPRIDLHHVRWDQSWWAKLRDILQGGVQQQVTLFGMMFSIAIVLIGIAAFLSGNNLIFLLLSAMLATMLVSGFISRLSLSGLRMRFLMPEHISARRKVQGRIIVENEKLWMPTFSIQLTKLEDSGTGRKSIVYFPCVHGGAKLEAPIDLYFPKRGTQHDNRFLFSSRFPFGFTERRIEVPVVHEILIYPCLDSQAGFEELLLELQGEIETQFRGQGHDFYRIRPYQHGESARYVDWKATAHTGRLQVREFARNSEMQVEIFLDLNSSDDEWFERAVDCSAFLTWRLTARGVGILFRTQEFEYGTPTDGNAYGILKYLATVVPQRTREASFVHDRDRYQILFTSQGSSFEASSNVRIVGPVDLASTGADSTGPLTDRCDVK
jgi:uncharacterized protein (DUF58 family)